MNLASGGTIHTLTTFGHVKKKVKSTKKFLSTRSAYLNLLVYQSAQKLSHVIYYFTFIATVEPRKL